ncbi:universal stress protein [uncultured Pseudonocardia sp.]|uniref:universal stress protein n=1 Tax=uncultured Pseudonocardia sp. TaxID=211455 RepID=UPI00260FE8D4|nr:universal stress protein [uncultured Pseudonocardia sp.]
MADTTDPTPHDHDPGESRDPAAELPPDARRIRIDGPDPGRGGGVATTLVLGHGRDPASAHALQVAADLAQRLRAQLQVVHGVDLDDYPIDPDAADWEQQAQHALDEQRRQVEVALSGTGRGWTYHASRADPVALIAAVAEEHDALMIIVGTRGEGFGATLQRLVGRSVSHGVIRAQHRPVLIVPAPEQQ